MMGAELSGQADKALFAHLEVTTRHVACIVSFFLLHLGLCNKNKYGLPQLNAFHRFQNAHG